MGILIPYTNLTPYSYPSKDYSKIFKGCVRISSVGLQQEKELQGLVHGADARSVTACLA